MAAAPIPQSLASLYGAGPVEVEQTGNTDLGKDAFLKLLTTQLQYQDPSNPASSQDFVAQLATFSSLEQLMGANETLGAVYAALDALNDSSMASLLGTTVVARGSEFAYDGEGGADLLVRMPADAATATVRIYDEDGKLVYTADAGPLGEGEQTLTWNGEDTNGNPVGEGTYRFEIEAGDAAGNTIETTELVSGRITSMDYSTGVPAPSINGVAIDLAMIERLTQEE